MAYNPLALSCDGQYSVPKNPNIVRTWSYKSDDAMSTVRVTLYFTDAYYRGMQVGDVMHVITTSSGAVSTQYIAAVMAVGDTGADISNGTSITVTNSD